jgi:hypothetical protein
MNSKAVPSGLRKYARGPSIVPPRRSSSKKTSTPLARKPLRQKFAAHDFGIELRAPVDVAHRDAEMRDAPDFRHGSSLFCYHQRRHYLFRGLVKWA